MIQCQCIQVLIDKMKHDTDWYNTSESHNTLALLKIIEKKYLLMPNINIAMQQ